MLYPVPFHAEHLQAMEMQPTQRNSPCIAQAGVLEGPHAFTLMQDGAPIVAAGAVPIHAGRASLWAFLTVTAGGATFIRVQSFARLFVESLPFRRLEAAVLVDFEPGHRWVRSLGFERETPYAMRAFTEDGQDCALYARVRS